MPDIITVTLVTTGMVIATIVGLIVWFWAMESAEARRHRPPPRWIPPALRRRGRQRRRRKLRLRSATGAAPLWRSTSRSRRRRELKRRLAAGS